jgi:hypothetical protein
VLPTGAEGDGHGRFDGRGEVVVEAGSGVHGGDQRLLLSEHDGVDESALGGEVAVHGLAGEPGPPGHVLQGHAGDPVVDDDRQGGVEDALSGVGNSA